jgi:hypothetical protein
MNNQKPNKAEIELATKIAAQITEQIFAHYNARQLITQDGKRAKISRTTLAEVAAKAFLAGSNHGKSLKGVA